MDYASHDSYFVEFTPTIPNEKNFASVESNKISMLVDHEKNASGAGYIVEFIMMLLNIIMREEYMLVGIAIISNFLSMCLTFLKLCLFYLPMQVDYCSHKLFAHKIPMHRNYVRFRCVCHVFRDVLFVFQFLSFMWASLSSSCLARGVKR